MKESEPLLRPSGTLETPKLICHCPLTLKSMACPWEGVLKIRPRPMTPSEIPLSQCIRMLSSSQWPASHYGFSHLFRHTLPVLPQPFPCRKSRDAGLAAALCQLTAVSESGAGKLRPSGVHPLNPGSVHKRSRSLIQPRHSAASARHPLVSQELVKTSVRNREKP